MKVKLLFDHPHDAMEWDAYEIVPGLVRCTSVYVYNPKSDVYANVRRFEIVVPKEQVKECNGN